MSTEREGLAAEIVEVIANHPRLGCGCCSWSEDCATCDGGEWVAHECPRDLDRGESIARSVADALADLLAARDRRVRAVLDEYFDFDADPWEDHDAACPAPEDVWRLHRDLKAALEGDA